MRCSACPLTRCDRHKWPGACESYLAARSPKPDPRPAWTPLPGLPVAFLGPTCQAVGGTERWHETLFRHLDRSRVQVLGYGVEHLADPDASARFGVPAVEGIEAMRDLVARARVVVAWGLRDPARFLPVGWRGGWVSVAHGDATSDWTRDWLERAKPMTTRYVGVSEAARLAFPPDRQGVVIAPGVPIPDRVAPWRPRHLVFAGRFSKDKLGSTIFDALQALPDWTASMIGDGPAEWAWRESARAVSDRVRWYRPDARWWEHHSGVCVLPSDSEGFGLAAAEGLAAAMPVVMRRVGMAVDPTCPVTIWEPGEPLAAAISRAPTEPQADHQAWVRRCFDPARQAELWTNLIEGLAVLNPAPKTATIPLAVVRERIRRARSCPHRADPRGCGCSGVAGCAVNKGNLDGGARATFQHCVTCQSEDLASA